VLDQGPPAALRHFTCKFSHKVALVKYPSAVGTKSASRSISALMAVQNVQAHFDCAGSHKVCVAVLVCGI